MTRGLDAPALAGVPGLRRRAAGGRRAPRACRRWCSDVDLDEFGEEALRAQPRGPRWLEEVARAPRRRGARRRRARADRADAAGHDLLDDDGVRARRRAGTTPCAGARPGRGPGGVEREGRSPPPAEPRPAAPTPRAGDRRRGVPAAQAASRTQRREAAEQEPVQVAEEIHAALAGHAVASRRLPPQDPRLTGRTEPMIAQRRLPRRGRGADEFAARCARVAGRAPGRASRCDGPWPPYSFAMLEQP